MQLIGAGTNPQEGCGWRYYSSSVPIELRRNINKALSRLVLKQLPIQWRKAYDSSPLSCGKVMGAIGYEVLVVLLALTVCPFHMKHLISIALSCYWSDIERQDTDGRQTVVAAHVSDSSSSSLGTPRNSLSSIAKTRWISCKVRTMYNQLLTIFVLLYFYLSWPNAYWNQLILMIRSTSFWAYLEERLWSTAVRIKFIMSMTEHDTGN